MKRSKNLCVRGSAISKASSSELFYLPRWRRERNPNLGGF
ncbi:hypothetical protein WQQ_03190 [Hydrocarboniphaga effusa AP103]|uniref:Uncharacterized protein n=1 Tax=Hydrocarboniphaga effusa AP103 TaxID=1172194 RepID=I8T7T6_9GAMM|nr:hypothetical protein WQQ_01320 [Hydrocarboniphaga effusa AP103]EIT70182.1 hypothetical protein WQQ_03190 [Hydrocarboniphaga effusa AP103]